MVFILAHGRERNILCVEKTISKGIKYGMVYLWGMVFAGIAWWCSGLRIPCRQCYDSGLIPCPGTFCLLQALPKKQEKMVFTVGDLLLFVFFRAAPMACGGSQARGRTGAGAASLHHSHSNSGSKLQLRPVPKFVVMLDP